MNLCSDAFCLCFRSFIESDPIDRFDLRPEGWERKWNFINHASSIFFFFLHHWIFSWTVWVVLETRSVLAVGKSTLWIRCHAWWQAAGYCRCEITGSHQWLPGIYFPFKYHERSISMRKWALSFPSSRVCWDYTYRLPAMFAQCQNLLQEHPLVKR